MDKFNHGAQIIDTLSNIMTQPCRQDQEDRSDTLAATRQHIPCDVRNEAHLGFEVLRNRCLDPHEVVLNKSDHFLGHHARVFHSKIGRRDRTKRRDPTVGGDTSRGERSLAEIRKGREAARSLSREGSPRRGGSQDPIRQPDGEGRKVGPSGVRHLRLLYQVLEVI
jgi:hypothetical protein